MFILSSFLPGTSKRNTVIGGAPWRFGWARRKVPTTGGQNYSPSELALPTYSLSGPLNTNARRFNPLEPAYAIDVRRWPDATVTGANILNGQIMSAPLVNPETGGFDRSMQELNARPFNPFRIQPAGQA